MASIACSIRSRRISAGCGVMAGSASRYGDARIARPIGDAAGISVARLQSGQRLSFIVLRQTQYTTPGTTIRQSSVAVSHPVPGFTRSAWSVSCPQLVQTRRGDEYGGANRTSREMRSLPLQTGPRKRSHKPIIGRIRTCQQLDSRAPLVLTCLCDDSFALSQLHSACCR